MKVFGNPIHLSQEDFRLESKKILDDMAILLAKKNADYGNASLENGGVVGNAVRLADKMSRLKTMIDHIVDDPNYQPNFEAIGDTLDDIIGYATIGRIIYNHWLSEREPK